MQDESQARAYALADFDEPHGRFVALFQEAFPEGPSAEPVLDLGCGSADIGVRFCQTFSQTVVHGVDGSQEMLKYGRKAVARARVTDRVRLFHGYLPGARLPRPRYDCIISNSLLHHLRDPLVLWKAIRKYGAPGGRVFVMDLVRPGDLGEARGLVERHAGGESPVLRRDFLRSLLAAYRPDEVHRQLERAALGELLVNQVSDRHMTIAGTLP